MKNLRRKFFSGQAAEVALALALATAQADGTCSAVSSLAKSPSSWQPGLRLAKIF
jgi:hypothetical protein